MAFKNKSDSGAVLVTEAPIIHRKLGHESPILNWMAKNCTKLLAKHASEVKRHGVWIVTKTYATRRCGIAVLTSKSAEVRIGLDVQVAGIATLTPSSSWSYQSGSSSSAIHEDDAGVVVFMSGIWFKRKLLDRSAMEAVRAKEKQRLLLGGRGGKSTVITGIRAEEPDGTEVELSVERFGYENGESSQDSNSDSDEPELDRSDDE